jgi:hypothetical protein
LIDYQLAALALTAKGWISNIDVFNRNPWIANVFMLQLLKIRNETFDRELSQNYDVVRGRD